MLVHRLSSTRLVSTLARANDQFLFTGSTLNRPKPLKKPAKPKEEPKPGQLHCLSNRSKDKIQNKIQSIFRASNGFTFATLTFINQVGDKAAVSCLNKFLTVCRKRCPGLQYLWVAERQTENEKHPGNIHFHVIVNKFLAVRYYNALWVKQQYNSGIEYPGMTCAEMERHFKDGTMQKELNPFDIKQVKTVEGLGFYLTKYVTKNDSSFECSPWYCSRGISAVFTSVLVGENVVCKAADKAVNWAVNKKTGEVYEAKTYVSEYATIRTIYNKKYFNRNFKLMDKINQKILAGKAFDVPTVDYLEYDCEYNQPFTRNKFLICQELKKVKRSAN